MRILIFSFILIFSLSADGQELLSGFVCGQPQLKEAIPVNNAVLLHWQKVDNAIEYQVAGRREDNGAWVIFSTSLNSLEILHLRPETNYEWIVRAFCTSGQWTDWQGSGRFSTLPGKSSRKFKDPLLAKNNPIITVYPIPSANKAVMEVYTKDIINNLSLKVYDSVGNVIRSEERINVSGLYEIELDTDQLATGIYNVVIIADQYLEKRSLILQR